MVFQGLEKENELNELTNSFGFQKITFQGTQGFFISFNNYKLLRITLLDYLYMQDELSVIYKQLNSYWKLEKQKRLWQQSFTISLAINISFVLVASGLCLLIYNIK
jgi:hypothetical protein